VVSSTPTVFLALLRLAIGVCLLAYLAKLNPLASGGSVLKRHCFKSCNPRGYAPSLVLWYCYQLHTE
jgi:hypothetical protein